MKRIILAALVGVLVSGPVSVVVAGFDEGVAAYIKGDYATALKEFRALAEQGDATAQYNLGVMYTTGQGSTKDFKEAMKWYRKAAEQGNASAQANLGLMYAEGLGGTQDFVQAHMWANIGAANKSKMAEEIRDFIEKRMTATDISKAQKLAREWMEKHQK